MIKEKLQVSWGHPLTETFAIKTAKGFEIWVKNISFHPWKKRDYNPILTETISHQEWDRRNHEQAQKCAVENEKNTKIQRDAERRKEWIESLPPQLDHETFVDKAAKGITDKYGNFIMPLPMVPVKNLLEWVKAQFDSNFSDF